jgi:hypothetical protein
MLPASKSFEIHLSCYHSPLNSLDTASNVKQATQYFESPAITAVFPCEKNFQQETLLLFYSRHPLHPYATFTPMLVHLSFVSSPPGETPLLLQRHTLFSLNMQYVTLTFKRHARRGIYSA